VLVAHAGRLERAGAVGDALPGGAAIVSFTLLPVPSMSPSGHLTFAVAPTATGGGPEGIVLAEPATPRPR
jgi:hypothetical protein